MSIPMLRRGALRGHPPTVVKRPARRATVQRVTAALTALRASLAERLAALRGVDITSLPAPLLDVVVRVS